MKTFSASGDLNESEHTELVGLSLTRGGEVMYLGALSRLNLLPDEQVMSQS